MSLMRKGLLWASTNTWIRDKAVHTRFVRRSVKKFMPGETVEDAIAAAVALKTAGISAILTRLGENITNIKEADEVEEHYVKVLGLIAAAGIDAQISIKPTQLGYDQNPEVCFAHCARLLQACDKQKTFFWLD